MKQHPELWLNVNLPLRWGHNPSLSGLKLFAVGHISLTIHFKIKVVLLEEFGGGTWVSSRL